MWSLFILVPALLVAGSQSIPVHFEANRGQAPSIYSHIARTGGNAPVLLSAASAVFPDFTLRLEGGNPAAKAASLSAMN